MIRIRDIAIITSGVFLKPTLNAEVKYLQSKHFNNSGEYLNNAFDEVDFEKSQKHLLKSGNILFSSKGTYNYATLYDDSMGECVASSTFSVIKLFDDSYLPEFVCWYLNHPSTQRTIKAMCMGTSVQHISISNLHNIEIPTVDIELQRKIVETDRLSKRVVEINNRLTELTRLKIDKMLINKII